MLRHTFIHLEGVGGRTERRLWTAGIGDWAGLRSVRPADLAPLRLSPVRLDRLRAGVDESSERLDGRDAGYFAGRLAPGQQWRLFADFASDAAYLDIETDGYNLVTAAVLHRDGQTLFFVRDRDLHELPLHLAGVRLLITYNGRCFDWPMLRASFARLPEPAAHLDLRYPFAGLKFRGGLKGIEQAIGCRRPDELADIDGASAVWLWRQHQAGNPRALPALLRYCAEDVLNLKFLAEWVHDRLAGSLPVGAALFSRPARAVCADLPSADPELMAQCRLAVATMFAPGW